MGAFVGNVTSPFLRRRKGRIGSDKWVSMTAPALLGAEIRFAAANNSIIICGENFASSYFVSRDGSNSWTTVAVVAPHRIGNNAAAGYCLISKPFHALDTGLSQENRFDAAGVHPGVGGGLTTIDSAGFFSVDSADVAGAPQESVAWNNLGKFRVTVGARVLGNIKCSGSELNAAPQFFDIPSAVPNGAAIVIGLVDDPNIGPYPAFLVGDTSGTAATNPVHKIHLNNLNNWIVRDIAVPTVDFAHKQLIQVGKLILAIDSGLARLMQSLDYGETWTAIANANGQGPMKDIYRYGRFFFTLSRDPPVIQRSSNNGTSWQTHPVALPDGGALPSHACVFNGERYIFCRDGVINRVYKHKHANDI